MDQRGSKGNSYGSKALSIERSCRSGCFFETNKIKDNSECLDSNLLGGSDHGMMLGLRMETRGMVEQG